MSLNITYEALAEQFTVRKLSGFGEVIIFPGDKFNPDWEAQLGEGYECIEHTYYGKPVTLVRKVVKENADANVHEKTDDRKPMKVVAPATEDDLLELRAHLDKRIDVLGESQAALKKEIAGLREKVQWLEDTYSKSEKFAVEVSKLLDHFGEHEHSVSGKIMVPLKKDTS